MFELRHLRYFVAVAEEGSINRAAARLHLTQPALSRQIRVLEDEVGECLLSRTGNSIRLTEAGQLMLAEARAVLERAESALARVRSSCAAPPFRLGYSPSLTAGVLSPALAAFNQKHPRLRVEMRDMASCEMIQALEKGEIDVAVTVSPERSPPGVVWHALCNQRMRVAMAGSHPLAAKKQWTPLDLNGQKLVLFAKDDYPEYWDRVTAWFKEQGVDAKVAGEYDGVSSLMAAVEAGLGVALVAERSDQLAPRGVVFRPITPEPDPVPVAVGISATNTDARAGVFIEELKRAAGIARS
jgi:DNA-binding transcriptional LysR family regulator